MSFRVTDPGKLRSIQRTMSDQGFFEICALDHQRALKTMLAGGGDPETISFEQVVALKDRVLRAVGPSVSGTLTDARYGGPVLVATGALGRDSGYMLEVGDEGYDIPPGARRTRLRAGWSMEKIKLAGGDVAKLLWFYRPDANPEIAEHQRDVLKQLVAESARWSLPLVVEPIYYPLIGEDTKDPAWKAARVRGIIDSAVVADELGADLLKLEFPGYIDEPGGEEASVRACEEVTARTTVPWVVLSAGVGFDDFVRQLAIACAAGASGYMAGRSVWQEVAVSQDAAERDSHIGELRRRLDRLNEVTRAHGRPVELALDTTAAAEQFPEFWYESWHEMVDA